VESRIIYLPLYPEDPEAEFNSRFFADSPNCLGRLLPDEGTFEEYVKVIDIPSASGKRFAHVLADPRRGKAVCYLDSIWPQKDDDSFSAGFKYLK
jgi:hypothetical protein